MQYHKNHDGLRSGHVLALSTHSRLRIIHEEQVNLHNVHNAYHIRELDLGSDYQSLKSRIRQLLYFEVKMPCLVSTTYRYKKQ